MQKRIIAVGLGTVALLAACGGEAPNAQSPSARQALTNTAEMLEFESPATRVSLFREIAQASLAEAGRPATAEALFPIVDRGAVIAAPGFDRSTDLLEVWDAGDPLQFVFDAHGRWPDDRRSSLQGLSEREASELVARSLIARWAIQPKGPIEVDRAPGAPYAVAYMDGILRVNPSFLYLAASTPASPAAPNQ